jgi:hypothetical protein
VAFLGVAFFVTAFFLGAAAFFAGLGAAGAVVLVTRPDLVFPRTRDTSFSTAGGAAALRGLLALALGFAAGFATAVFLAAGFATAFFAAGAFLVAVTLGFYEGLVDEDEGQENTNRCGGLLGLGGSRLLFNGLFLNNLLLGLGLGLLYCALLLSELHSS